MSRADPIGRSASGHCWLTKHTVMAGRWRAPGGVVGLTDALGLRATT